jgi:hypothetical protein
MYFYDGTYKMDEWGVHSVDLVEIYLEQSLIALESVHDRIQNGNIKVFGGIRVLGGLEWPLESIELVEIYLE